MITSFVKLKNYLIYLFLNCWAVLGLHCCTGFPPVVTSGGYSLVAVCRPLAVVDPLVVERRP